MATCASVRRKGSTEPCCSRALVGHTLCGVHARAKSVILWSSVNGDKLEAATRIQAGVRGWLLRRRLALAGPGVLSRAGVANTEDLETCEVADPLSYFGFIEAGKTWWFDFATIWKWAQTSVEPTNPYTRVPLDVATRKRLHRLWSARRHRRESIPTDPIRFEDRLRSRWTITCQVFANYGLGTMQPDLFLRLTKNDYIVLFRMLRDDLRTSHPNRYALNLIHRCLITAWTLPPTQFILQGSYALMAMLLHAKDPYPLAFYILAALYRL
jgi:hypothetical protein